MPRTMRMRMLSAASFVRWQITCSGLTISTLWSTTMSAAVTMPGPFLFRVTVVSSTLCRRIATSLRLSRTSITSSCRPSSVVYSCRTPSISTSVIAAPGIEESSTRRSALPSVWPKPRSSGSTTTFARFEPVFSDEMPRGRSTLLEVTAMRMKPSKLLGVELDDQVFVDVGRQIGALRQSLERARHLFRVDLDPTRREVHLLRQRQRFLDAKLLARTLGDRDLVARLDLEGRQVDLLAVDHDGLVRDELARLRPRHGEAHAIDDVVEALLEDAEQVLAGVALLAGGLRVDVAELALEQAVDALDLLLLAQLDGVVGQATLLRRRAVLAGLLLELALRVERASGALERQVGAFAARELAGGTDITCHGSARSLHATPLGRTAAVVRDRRHVDDVGDLVADRVERADRGFATRARALDANLERLEPVFLRGTAGALGRDLRGERRRLARAAETGTAGRRPRKRVALAIGDRHDRVVEGRLDVRDAVGDDALGLLLGLRRGVCCCGLVHVFLPVRLALGRLARALAGAGVRAGALAAQREAATMAQATVATEVHQALHADRDLAAEVTLDRVLGHLVADLVDLGLGEVADLGR